MMQTFGLRQSPTVKRRIMDATAAGRFEAICEAVTRSLTMRLPVTGQGRRRMATSGRSLLYASCLSNVCCVTKRARPSRST